MSHASSSPPPELQLEQFLPYRLAHLAERISQSLAEIYAREFELSIAEWRILAWLHQRHSLTASQICDLTDMDKARVSRAVKSLGERELLARQRTRRDQRSMRLSLTEAGQALMAEAIPLALEWEGGLVDALSGAEYRDLFRLLNKLDTRLDQLIET
ncbi:phage replication protein O, N-terminal domain-containing protein [Franzmannia pantelleriensis]|uniref:Phage replication protein O, N-terminal domain-containing protein n=1 Tax=Franzmannia pantelleriensis TaxID=48727 RepID=A0A1G9UW65_9GAMM|nr:MarR family winged helix-turn-helix transcriptional regulator [Halomonas pantelleriensis]SDM63855.1 phage replication protein O, N-terminal domain-containing protein [Halomonas pantelleriensis]